MADPDSSTLPELRRAITEALLELERAEGPLPRLAAAREVRALADALELHAISEARDGRASWARIGALYGLTKQGAQQRFGDRLPVAGVNVSSDD